ncbi:hypothetical protein [Amycolatopsis sp. La24]|uniref:hypothetical protein n=1 Tax=Amycolatopsis sp. La24 TaxID=3028304 RepID=UPI0023B1131E|nr:hypothetical protein [Amycolatopsis sp. La24]
MVGAVVLNAKGRAFVQLRSADRELYPNTWDVVGGKVKNCAPGDTLIRDVVAAALFVHNGSTGETPG